jgi:hypothetical protein
MSRTGPKPASAGSQRNRLLRAFRFGPGILLAILAVVVIGIRERPTVQAPGDRPGYPRSGWMEHAPRVTQRPAATPDLSELLARADALRLTPRQRTTIVRLMKQWAPESAERRRDMGRAATQFTQFMQGTQRRGQGGLQEIERHATATSALTTEWLARKAYFWQHGLAALTPEQRQRLQQMPLRRRVVPPLGVRRDR